MADKAVHVAYEMLEIAKDKGIALSNLQLQKLVYIAHGYFLGWKGKPLIKETVEAWKYGPVIGEVYQEFKGFGSQKISVDSEMSFPPIDDNQIPLKEYVDEKIPGDMKECLEGVLKLYGSNSATDLISITHAFGTPWDEVWNRQNGMLKLFAEMPNDLIKKHYEKIVKDPSSVSGL